MARAKQPAGLLTEEDAGARSAHLVNPLAQRRAVGFLDLVASRRSVAGHGFPVSRRGREAGDEFVVLPELGEVAADKPHRSECFRIFPAARRVARPVGQSGVGAPEVPGEVGVEDAAVCAQHVEVANADRDRAGARALRALRRAYPLAALERSRGCCCLRDGWGEGKAEEIAPA